jgi:hypothetical protein
MRADIVPGAVFPDYELETNEFRAGVGALWPFLSDAGRKRSNRQANKLVHDN